MILFQAIAYVILTGLLAFFTFKYMKYTKKMADIMKEEFEVKVKPVIEWRSFIREIKLKPPIGKYLIYVSNLGNSRIILEAIAIKYWHGSYPNKPKVELRQINEILTPYSTKYYEFELDFTKLKESATGYSFIRNIFCEPIINYRDSRNRPYEIRNRFFMATEERRVLI
jgi:hypothetical protein